MLTTDAAAFSLLLLLLLHPLKVELKLGLTFNLRVSLLLIIFLLFNLLFLLWSLWLQYLILLIVNFDSSF